ncbi:MAG: DUF2917 domain-containing protein [Noviherbaspirillum sp.]
MPRQLPGRDGHARSSRTSSGAHTEYELQENQPLRLLNTQGSRIECRSGVVWLTAYKEPVDVMLYPGDVFVVPNNRLVLMEAVGHGRVRIAAPRLVPRQSHLALLRIGLARLFARSA